MLYIIFSALFFTICFQFYYKKRIKYVENYTYILSIKMMISLTFLYIYFLWLVDVKPFTPLFFLMPILFSILVHITFVDLKHLRIPNFLVVQFIVVSVFHLILLPDLTFWTVKPYLLNALFSTTFFLLIHLLTKNFGLGDVKLIFPMSLWFTGWEMLFFFQIAGVIALIFAVFYKIVKKGVKKIPLAPALNGAFLLTLYFYYLK